ncbi:predicted protein, partial [Nematostella vectensis]
MADGLIEAQRAEKNLITEGKYVILKSGNNLRIVQVLKDRKIAFERLHFFLDDAIGCHYGTTFEVDRDKVRPCWDTESSQPIKCDGDSQKLSKEDIQSLKAQGLSGKDIVDQLVQNSETYKDRTEFSKAKYRKRKSKKYVQHIIRFTIHKPNTCLLAETYYSKMPQKICDLRPDALSQILTLANIRANSRVLVMEQCQGMIVGSILDRMGGYGSIVQAHNGDFPTRIAMDYYNFSSEFLSIVHGFPLIKLNTLTEKTAPDEEIKGKNEDREQPQDTRNTSRNTDPLSLSKAEQTCVVVQDKLARRERRLQEELTARNELLKGDMDALVIVCKFHPAPVLMALLPFLAPSRPFVVFCAYKEPLMDCYVNVRAKGGVVHAKLTETWLRYYQVLPSRTHPHVNMNTSGGYLLSGITV